MAEISLASYKNLLMEGNEEQINKYDVIRKIGAGTFGTVYLICSKSTNRLFAMKKLNKTYITQNRLK
jgi:serine/threonine protein kinase